MNQNSSDSRPDAAYGQQGASLPHPLRPVLETTHGTAAGRLAAHGPRDRLGVRFGRC